MCASFDPSHFGGVISLVQLITLKLQIEQEDETMRDRRETTFILQARA